MMSSLISIFRRKEDSLNPNSSRGIKLLEHAFKLYEKILDGICMKWEKLIKYSTGLCQREGLLMLCLFTLR